MSLTFRRVFIQPLLGEVVRQYDLVKEIEVSLTTGLDSLSANVLYDRLLLSRGKKRQGKRSLSNFSFKGFDIFSVCSSSGGQEVTERITAQRKARIRRRIAAVQLRGLAQRVHII